jgi:hypothetical protein
MSETLEGYRPVSAEARGLARQFRGAVKLADDEMQQALAAITAPLQARLKRTPSIREETVIESIRAYRATVPERFRVGEISGARDRRAFALRDTRLTVSWLIDHGWDEPEKERGVTIAKFVFGCRHGKLIQEWMPLVAVLPHALGRRIERGADRSHAALFVDLAGLAGADGEEVPTPASGGLWLGTSAAAQNDGKPCRIFNVRTWLPN